MKPLINIITRCSRKDRFIRCLDSVNNQTHEKIKHIITYQTDDMYDFLKGLDYRRDTRLVRVPNLSRIKDLFMFFPMDDAHEDFTRFDWNEKDYRIHIGKPNDFNKNEIETHKTPVLRFEKNGFWCTTLGRTVVRRFPHFPFESFCKIAEQHVENGWIIYLDDDDLYTENDSIFKLVNQIIKYDKDTMHVFKVKRHGTTMPSDGYFKYMSTGVPFMYGEIGISNYCFHSKYKDYTYWDEWGGSDFRNAKVLEKIIPKKNFFDYTIVDATNLGWGRVNN